MDNIPWKHNGKYLGNVEISGYFCIEKRLEKRKTGKDYDFHLALNNILGNMQYGISEAITLCNDNVSKRGKVVYLPVYMTMFLQRKQEVAAVEFVPDISALT